MKNDLEKQETIDLEIKWYKQLTQAILKGMFVFTYPEETREKYPEYFI